MEHYAAVKERLVAGVPRDGTAIVGVDDEWCRKIADRLAAVRQTRGAGFGAAHIEQRALRRGRAHHARRRGWPSSDSPNSAASVRCAGGTMRRTPLAPRRRRSRSASNRRRSRRACAHFRGCRIGWRKSAGAVPFSSSTIPRPPTPIRRRRRSLALTTFSGSPAANRRPAASKACGHFSRASARPI